MIEETKEYEIAEMERIIKNEKQKKYHRTKKGLISSIYGNQIKSSKQRGHNPPSYTKDDLYEYLITSETFNMWRVDKELSIS